MATDRCGIKELYPSLQGGKEWYCTSWNNKLTRTITPNKFDPYDNKLGICSGNIRIKLILILVN
jgi:hypothetical protein